MQKWDISEIRTVAKNTLKGFDAMHIDISELFFGSTDEHVLEVFGECKAKKKAKSGRVLTIDVLEDKEGLAYFLIKKVNVISGGDITEKEVFFIEEELDDEHYNVAFANAIEDFNEKAREYNHNMEEKDAFGFYRRAFVVFEQDDNLRPILKWIVADHIYYEGEFICLSSNEKIRNIKKLDGNIEFLEFDEHDFYEMAMTRGKSYEFPEYLTMVHVKADITYQSFDEGEKIVHINDMFENYVHFSNELSRINKDIKYSNLKTRWQKTEGIDIDKMNGLTEVLLTEHYLKYGLTKFNDEYKMNRSSKYTSYQKFLNEQTSLEDYISVLTHLLVGSNEAEIRTKILALKNNKGFDSEDVFHQFIEEYLGNDIEVGKVYLVEVNEEHHKVGEETDISEVEFIKEVLYLELKKKLIESYDFDCVLVRDVPIKKSDRTGKMSYLVDNVHEKEGIKYIHGWVGDILPVVVTGFHEDGTPITNYAAKWFSV